ncbi:hypothetical protein B7463_g7364, partial [Scytalidium lignicola]
MAFHPLFRLLDDFDSYSRRRGESHPGHHQKVFTPKFDVKEIENAYELHGELPGIDQEDITIDFTDENTLNVRGYFERHYKSSTPPRGFIEDSQEQKQIEGHREHQPTTEDDPNEPATSQNKVAKQEQKKPEEAQAKYWISERSVGEFARCFSFPSRVDHDAVTASMKNGILSIIVPKAKKHETRKIVIS